MPSYPKLLDKIQTNLISDLFAKVGHAKSHNYFKFCSSPPPPPTHTCGGGGQKHVSVMLSPPNLFDQMQPKLLSN